MNEASDSESRWKPSGARMALSGCAGSGSRTPFDCADAAALEGGMGTGAASDWVACANAGAAVPDGVVTSAAERNKGESESSGDAVESESVAATTAVLAEPAE